MITRAITTLSAFVLTISSCYANIWHTAYQNDEMRGTAQKYNQNDSENKVNFEFPYNGGSSMSIVLRSKKIELKEGQKPEDLVPTEAMLVISKGQFLCSSFSECHVSVKFDNEKVQKFSMGGAADGSSNVIFFKNSSEFIKKLQSHKTLFIEAPFFQAGDQQFKFTIDGYSPLQK
ncbi:hypothetical protein [Erwinia rhapontici]|uniref:hypothetical protein n=1 Tax=Erwinia rhapontici TaxID=55212 RepID=UPI003BA32227